MAVTPLSFYPSTLVKPPAYVYVALYLYNDSTNLPLLMLHGGDVKSLRYVLFSVESMHVLIFLHHAALLLGFASDHE